jgi:hypothetical protein
MLLYFGVRATGWDERALCLLLAILFGLLVFGVYKGRTAVLVLAVPVALVIGWGSCVSTSHASYEWLALGTVQGLALLVSIVLISGVLNSRRKRRDDVSEHVPGSRR